MLAYSDAMRLDGVASNNLNSTAIVQLGLGSTSTSQASAVCDPQSCPQDDFDSSDSAHKGDHPERFPQDNSESTHKGEPQANDQIQPPTGEPGPNQGESGNTHQTQAPIDQFNTVHNFWDSTGPEQDSLNTSQAQAQVQVHIEQPESVEHFWNTFTTMESEEHSQSPAPAAAGDSKSHNVPITNEDLKIMRGIVDYISDYKDLDGHEVGGAFQRIPNKRIMPDYLEVIKEPRALSTIRSNIGKKLYSSYREFVRDWALITYNAQVYNRPSAEVYQDAITLRELVKLELAKLVEKNIMSAEEAQYPDLGEIPDVEDSPPPDPDEEDAEEDEDDEEEDEEDEDTDEERPKRGRVGRKLGRPTLKRESSKVDDSKDDPESRKVRGRPPKVLTPMEARINTLLKGLRKFKHPGGELKILPFEKLPDKSQMPEYYQEIEDPIAMDLIKRKAKRKKYQSVDSALRDIDLMFDNAKAYNLDNSQVYKDAVDLQQEAHLLADQEKQKPDSDFVDEDGRLPLLEILHNGEVWKVGDWVHIQNPNDLTKPIVAQIYRTWQDQEGQKWVNACWYYRPEQTVHRYEKHFFENEVVKTGRYQDHQVDEIVDRCFVMFFTRFNKGRPRGFPADKEVYVCEARYNEEKFKLNKIKTWASCVPDEVREKDYEMDLFDVPRKMKKFPSPIKHLLREDAKEDDPLPKPTWGASNAPPIVGAVHRRPRELNESPPPSPTPEPTPQPIQEQVRPSTSSRPYDNQGDTVMGNTNTRSTSFPSTSYQGSYGQQFAASRPSASPAPYVHGYSGYDTQTGTNMPVPQTPHFSPVANYSSYGSVAPGPTPNPMSTYTHSHVQPQYSPARISTQSQSHSLPVITHTNPSGPSNAYNPPRPVEVYHLTDSANASIPLDIRQQFHRDEFGRVLFFTAPPLNINPVAPVDQDLGHSLSYLAKVARDNRLKAAAAARKKLEMTAFVARQRARLRHNLKVEATVQLALTGTNRDGILCAATMVDEHWAYCALAEAEHAVASAKLSDDVKDGKCDELTRKRELQEMEDEAEKRKAKRNKSIIDTLNTYWLP